MITSFITYLQSVLLPMGPFGIFAASFLEEVIAPIPSAIVMLGSGFLFLHGSLSFALIMKLIIYVAIPVACGVTIGSLVVYTIAKYIGVTLLIKWGKIFGVTEDMVGRAEMYFGEHKRDDIAVLVARIIPIVPAVVIALGAGLIRMPLLRYMTISFIGTIVRASILGLLGWQVGSLYTEYASYVSRYENWVLLICVCGVGIGLVRLYIKNKKKQIHGHI